MSRARRRESASDESDREQSKVALSKRRKTGPAFVPTFKQDLSSDEGASESDGDPGSDGSESDDDDKDDEDVQDEDGPSSTTVAKSENGTIHASRKQPKAAVKPLTVAELEAVNARKARTGVLYLSKVPPFMKPEKVKHLLSQYGETNRIFLAPEDARSHARRVRFGGNKRKMFIEGWIEFTDKRKAKLIAETLNTQKIGGKKGSFYHDDLWNLTYLPKFKWDDLTAQIAAENASRQARLAAEIEQGKREASHYLKNAERAKMIAKIQATRTSRRNDAANDTTAQDVGAGKRMGQGREVVGEEKMRRQFNQRDVKDKTKPVVRRDAAADDKGDEKMTRVMNSIFG